MHGCFDGEALGTILKVQSFPGILNLADKKQPKTNCNQTHCYHACYFHRDGWYIVLIHRILSKKNRHPKWRENSSFGPNEKFSGHFGWKCVGVIKIVMNKMSTGTTITKSYRQNISAVAKLWSVLWLRAFPKQMAVFELAVRTAIWAFQVYEDTWTPTIGEEFVCSQERANKHDARAVAVYGVGD